MGATCFMSVILQSFVHNPLLRNFYLSDGHQTGDCARENCMNCAMDDLFQDFYAQDKIDGFSPSNILYSSWASKQAAFASLAGYDEQDAHEFFQFLAQELHRTNKGDELLNEEEDLKNGDNTCNCIIHQTFYGKFQSTVTCQNCESVTTSVEPFLDLSLGLNNIARKRQKANGTKQTRPLTLQRCLDEEYKRPERCEYTCQTCAGPQDAKKQLSIKRLPNVLCVQFKVRYSKKIPKKAQAI
jgi:ubiquitin carboxyl-terminal hydrolase 22/27/51